MAKQTNEYHPIGFNIAGVFLTAADTTTVKLIMASGANDSTVNQFTICNAAGEDAEVELLFFNGTTDFLLSTLTIPASAGALGGIPAYDVLGLDCIYNATIQLKAGWSIRARAKATVAGTLTFLVIATDY